MVALRMSLRSMWRSPALRATFIFGLGGIGFSLGSVLLARALTITEYAWLALIIAFSQISMGIGPWGSDTIVNRFPIRPSFGFLLRIGSTSCLVAMGLVIIAYLVYRLPPSLVLLLFVLCVGISVNKVASALYQSTQRFGQSLFFSQVHNGLVLVAAIGALVLNFDEAIWVCLILTVGYIVTAVWAWRCLITELPSQEARSSREFPWRDSFAIVGQGTAVILFIQLERFLVPKLLDAESLSTVAVLAAIAGSPFRMLQMGIGYTMLPRLSAAKSVRERRQVINVEVWIVSFAIVGACVAIWILAPFIVTWLLDDKYVLGPPLIAAALFAGVGKVIGAFATSAVTAVGNGKDLNRLNWMSWGALVIATVGAYFGARWGLVGVIYGISTGWLVYALGAIMMASQYFSEKMAIVSD